MGFLKDVLFMLVRAFLYKEVVRGVRKKGVLLYLRIVRAVRQSLLAAIVLFVTLQLMVIGFVGSVVVGIFLWPQDLETRLWVLFGIFGAFFLIPFLGLLIFFSEKMWFQLSGAKKMVSELNS